jgi:gluconolactonase
MPLELIIEKQQFLDLIDPDQDYKKIMSGLTVGEGPVWHEALQKFFFNDIPASYTYIYREGDDNAKKAFYNGCRANGMSVDLNDRLIMCEHATSRVVSWDAEGKEARILVSHYGDVELNSPNDVIVRSDGRIYFSDPIYGRLDKPSAVKRSIPSDLRPVYMYNPSTMDVVPVAKNFTNPNGLCFSPEEEILYVDDSETNRITAYDVHPDGTLTGERLIIVVPNEWGTPDGMKVDELGNLIIAASNGLVWLTPGGELIGRVVKPESERLLNFCFGGKDRRTILLACNTGVYVLRSKIRGAVRGTFSNGSLSRRII